MADTAYPGWKRLQADLARAADAGESVTLTALDVMVILGEAKQAAAETKRLRDRLGWATALLRQVERGEDCNGWQHGWAPCEVRGLDLFMADTPKRRRWWRHGSRT